MRSWFVSASAALSCAALAPGAWAGPADPVPLIGGTDRAQHVFTITGITSSTTTGAAIFCTSLEKTKDIRIAVEALAEQTGDAINDITGGTPSDGVPEVLQPGETVTTEISGDGVVTFTNEDARIAATLFSGSARVVSTSPKLMCAAMILDKVNALPGFAGALPVVSKLKQKGE